MDGYARYAVYWAPEPGSSLAALGAAWLGWDPEAGVAPAPPALMADRRERLTAAPRGYGLHATLKAPFRLARGATVRDLDAAVAALAAREAPVTGLRLGVDTGLGFAALRPVEPAPGPDRLAAACVTGLDGLRAPLAAAERARRLASGLDTAALARLDRWGYPHVLGGFRFHVTLTGALAEAERESVAAALARHLAPALAGPLTIRHLCVLGDPGHGRPFRLIARHTLSG